MYSGPVLRTHPTNRLYVIRISIEFLPKVHQNARETADSSWIVSKTVNTVQCMCLAREQTALCNSSHV